jgi:hypothetical protein
MAREELISRPSPRCRTAGAYGGFDVAALGADSRHEQGHVAGQCANAGDFAREGGADDERALAARIPVAADQAGEPLVELFTTDVEKLQVAAAGVRGSTEHDDALVADKPDRVRCESRPM